MLGSYNLYFVVADYRNYASLDEFFKSQVDNETFVRMYEEHLKHFQDDREVFYFLEKHHCAKLKKRKTLLPKYSKALRH